jgi:hypothetical protein
MSLLEAWEGTEEPEPYRGVEARSRWNPEGPATDYDRACDVTDLMGTVPVGGGEGLVLGDEPLATTWWPAEDIQGGFLVRWEYAQGDTIVRRWMSALPVLLSWEPGVRYHFDEGPLILFDSAEPGLESFGARLEITLAGGTYKVQTKGGGRTLALRSWCIDFHRAAPLPNPRMQPTGRVGPRSVRTPHSRWPSSGRVDLCGREDDRLQLMRMSLGVSHKWGRSNSGASEDDVQVRVQLKDILEGMEFQSDEVTAFLHRPTGRVIAVSDEAVQAAEEGAGADEVEEFELADARGFLEAGEDYLALPDRFEIDEYRMMERFATGVADPAAQAELGNALRGRGAFRRFKDAVRRLELAEEWYAYRDRGYEDVARAWCEAHGIVVEPPSG